MTEKSKHVRRSSQDVEQINEPSYVDDVPRLEAAAHPEKGEELNYRQVGSLAFQKMLLTSQSEASPDGILVVSNERQWLSINQRFIEMWQIPEQVVASRDSRLALQSVKSQLADPVRFLSQIEHLYKYPNEHFHDEIYMKDGRVLEQYSRPVRDEEGIHYGRVWYYRDITERKSTEEKLHRQTAQLEALHQIGLELASQLDLDDLLKSIMSHLTEILETDLGALSLYQPEKDILKIVATNDDNTSLIGRTFQRGEGLAGKIWQTGSPMIIDDYRVWEEQVQWVADRIGHKAAVGVPIYWEDQVQGVITISSAKQNYKFSHSDVTLLSMFATQAAVALQNAHLYVKTQQHAFQLEQEIAEREKTERALREHQQRYQALFEQTNDAVFIIGPDLTLGTELIHHAVNQQASDLLGYTVEEMLFMPIKNIVAPETWDSSVEVAKTLSKKGSMPVYERMMIKKDGTLIWVEINPLQVYDDDGQPLHILSIVRDISERKQAEEALQQVNNSLRQRVNELAILNQISQTLTMVTDMQSALQIVAKTMGEMFRTYNTVISLYNQAAGEVELVMHYSSDPDDPSLIGLTIPLTENTSTSDVIQTGKPLVVPQPLTNPLTKHLRKYVRERKLQHLLSVPLRSRATVVGIITMARIDAAQPFTTAEIKLAETIAGNIAGAIEITRLLEETQQAREVAEAANQAKSQFLATMSHELRTPLNGILGYAQLLQRDTAVTPYQRSRLSIIEQSGNHLSLLINDILDWAKIEARKVELYEANFYLPAFLHTINEMMQFRAEEKGITFHFESGHLPTAVYGDQKRLRQVLINLLGNAIKFTDKGSVTFHVQTLEPTDPSATPQFHFQIEDTGRGISAEDLPAIFEPFQQVGDKNYRSKGAGLGLAISHTLIQLMHGELQVKSELGAGSTFWFEIPLGVSPGWKVETAVDHPKIIGINSIPPTILIVDDRSENRSLLVNLLSPLGFGILEADNGQHALAIVKSSQPDAIITDLFMPQMDGFELVRHIRNTPEIKEPVIIVTSATIQQDNLDEDLMPGNNAFIAKPIQIDDLLLLLQQLLDIDWLYQSVQNSKPVQTIPHQLPPHSELEILNELALKGDVAALLQRASSLMESNEALQPFATQLQQLAGTFKVNEICAWLASYL